MKSTAIETTTESIPGSAKTTLRKYGSDHLLLVFYGRVCSDIFLHPASFLGNNKSPQIHLST